MIDLEQVRARAAAASQGAWQRHGSDVWLEGSPTPLFTGRDGSGDVRRQADADAEFIAHAREDIINMLALLDQEKAPGSAQETHSSAAPQPIA